MTPAAPMRLVMDSSSTALHAVPPSNAIRALLHHTGFRRIAATSTWELPRALPRAMRIARIAELVRLLDQARVPLAIDDRRPASANPREVRSRLAEIYSGPWTFATGHQSYILAVAATVQVRGLPVRDIAVEPGELAADPSAAAAVQVKPRTAAMQLADGRAVAWDETVGWRDTNTGAALPISQVADPATVASAVASLPVPSTVDTARDPARLDPLFEQALAVYRTHPGALALHRARAPDVPGPYRLLPNDVRAIQQWQRSTSAPARWEAATLIALEPADNVAQAWPTSIRRSSVTSYPPPTLAAQRQLRQARLRRAADQQAQRQR